MQHQFLSVVVRLFKGPGDLMRGHSLSKDDLLGQ